MTELSIIIVASSHDNRLLVCLEALCHQSQPAADFEVIVVGDDAGQVLVKGLANLNLPYKWQVQGLSKSGGPGAARNIGVEAASGTYCLFLAPVVPPEPNLVEAHLNVQRTRGGVIGIGSITITLAPPVNAFARYMAQERQDRLLKLNEGMMPSPLDCCGDNLSLPRAAILKTGGFAEDLSGSESVELAYRLERDGLCFAFIQDAVVIQEFPGDFKETAVQIESEGAASIGLYWRHPPLLAHMPLGAFNNMHKGWILVRRCLLPLGLPTGFLALIEMLLRANRLWLTSWNRFLRSYFYWQGVRRAVPSKDVWLRLVSGTKILMYHACGLPHEQASRYVVPGPRFARQMAWLKRCGYRVLSLEEFLKYHAEYRLPPSHSVVITFDDGYADNHTVAYPVLRRHGFPATIFLVSGMMGGTNRWDKEGDLVGRPLLSWSDAHTMMKGGISFGAHTQSHRPLTLLSLSKVKEEVEGSQADLERGLGVPITAFAYPHGDYNSAVQKLVEGAGFLASCTCQGGVNDPIVTCHTLRRVGVRGTHGFVRFVLALL